MSPPPEDRFYETAAQRFDAACKELIATDSELVERLSQPPTSQTLAVQQYLSDVSKLLPSEFAEKYGVQECGGTVDFLGQEDN